MNGRHDLPSSRLRARDAEIASGVPADLDSLPRLGGFRLRGLEMTRLETFIDAAFAFAITMLVIAAQQIPDDIETLLAAFKNVPAFVASVIVVGIFWRGHWLWSRRYGLEDGKSIFISWAMMVTILIYIYPLKAIFNSMWFLLSDGHLGHPLGLRRDAQARCLFAIFALGFTAIAFEILLLNLRAWQLREPLRLNDREKLITRQEITGWSVPVGVGIVSLGLALALPIEHVAWSGWVYFSMVILVPLHSAYRRRRMERKAEGGGRKK
jgi:Endosomal/lysosomal potassium channel TMEM175